MQPSPPPPGSSWRAPETTPLRSRGDLSGRAHPAGPSAKRPRTTDTWSLRNPYSPAPREAATAPPAGASPHDDSSAELYEYLANRRQANVTSEKEIKELRAEVSSLKSKLLTAEQDRIKTSAEAQAQASRWLRDEADMEKALSESTSRAHAALQRCEQVEARATEHRLESAVLEQSLRGDLQQAEQVAADTERKLATVQAELTEVRLKAKDAARQAKSALDRQEALVKAADSARAASEAQLGKLEAQLAEAEARAASAEQRSTALEIQIASKPASEDSTTAVELSVIRRELQSAQAEAAQVKVLRQHVANVDLLREQLATQESRCRRLQQEVEGARSAQVRLTEAETAISLWQSAASSLGPDCRAPEDVPRRAADLQRESLQAVELQGQFARQERKLKMKVAELEAQVVSLQNANATSMQVADDAKMAMSRQERKTEVLAMERDSLQRILASYDQEKSGLSQEGDTTAMGALRYREAEATATLLRERAAVLEKELSEGSEALQASKAEVADLKQKLTEAETAGCRIEAEAARLGKEVALLNEKLGRGEFDRSHTKVLHFIANPEALALKEAGDATLLAVTAERDSLAAQVAKLQTALTLAGGSAAQSTLPCGSQTGASTAPGAGGDTDARQLAVLQAEKVVLQRQVAEIEKRELRLKEVFKERIQSFREACYQLFGYRVDMASDSVSRGAGTSRAATSFILRPSKADSKDDHLHFRFTTKTGMELLDTPFTSQPARHQEIQTFIGKFRSVPAFTANLTMELFQKQTQC